MREERSGGSEWKGYVCGRVVVLVICGGGWVGSRRWKGDCIGGQRLGKGRWGG